MTSRMPNTTDEQLLDTIKYIATGEINKTVSLVTFYMSSKNYIDNMIKEAYDRNLLSQDKLLTLHEMCYYECNLSENKPKYFYNMEKDEYERS